MTAGFAVLFDAFADVQSASPIRRCDGGFLNCRWRSKAARAATRCAAPRYRPRNCALASPANGSAAAAAHPAIHHFGRGHTPSRGRATRLLTSTARTAYRRGRCETFVSISHRGPRFPPTRASCAPAVGGRSSCMFGRQSRIGERSAGTCTKTRSRTGGCQQCGNSEEA